MKRVFLHDSVRCTKGSVILGNHQIEEGKEVEHAIYCLNLIEMAHWDIRDIQVVTLFDGDKEICRRPVFGFNIRADEWLGFDEAVIHLAKVFGEMLNMGANQKTHDEMCTRINLEAREMTRVKDQ